MSDTRRIVFLSVTKDGKGNEYQAGDEAELPFLEASVYINYGWAKDYYSGMQRTPVLHVSVFTHDQCISTIGQ